MIVEQLVSRGAQGATVTDDHLARNWLEIGTEVLHRFDYDDSLRFGLDSKAFKLLQIQQLLGQAGDRIACEFALQVNGGRPSVVVPPANISKRLRRSAEMLRDTELRARPLE